MTLDKIDTLSLTEMKLIAKDLGIRGSANVTTKEKMVDKIKEHCSEFGLAEVPDMVKKELDVEPAVISNRPVAMAKKRIDSFPKKKVIVEARDSECVDHPFSVNEYSCYIQMGKEVLLPEPIVEFIKSITEVYHRNDPDTGFSKHEELNKFFVRYV
jgi:hypothetical protein